MEPEAVPGTPWEGEISLGNSPRGPPEDNNEFFFDPGGLRERFGPPPGRLLEPSWRPRGPRRPPGAILAPFWHHLGSNFGGFLEHFGALFWSHSPFALAILAPFWEPKWSPEASCLELLCNTLGLYFPPIRRPSNAVTVIRR